ncbi:two-component system, sensor histidine kinase and response regulator [Gammaproteobacteria bacterium]
MTIVPPHIFVIEDSPTQAIQLQFLLEEQGWTTELYDSAETALDRLAHVQPDLILVDYHLPRMRGDELTRLLRMNVKTRALPVVMLTDAVGRETEQRGFESGADAYVAKSTDNDVLLARVQSLLRNQVERDLSIDGETSSWRARILIVDDSRTFLEYLQDHLEQEGYEVTALENGVAALTKAEVERFDCVVVDLIMPGMNGIELCQHLDSLRRKLEQPFQIVMLTSLESKEDMMRGLEAGADDFVGKSGDIEILRARIRALLRRKILHEENLRITQKFRNKELELAQARSERMAAETRAALAEQLEITNRELIRAKEVAEQASRAKSAFVANMSHEIRTPMNAILSLVYLLEQTMLSPIQHNYLEKVHRSAQSLLGILNDILDFSKVEAERLELEQLPFNLYEVLKTLGTITEATAREKDIEVVFQIPREIPESLVGDGLRLQQVLLNLLGNAIKFTKTGSVVLTIERVPKANQKVYLQFSVEDTGIGITPELQKMVFDPFSQGDSSTTRRFGGTGLGLAICRRLVDLMGGELELSSVPGKGSIFTFAACFGLGPETLLKHPSLSQKRMLIADHHPITKNTLSSWVTSLGAQATSVGSIHETLSVLAQPIGSFDLLWLDWRILREGGQSFVRHSIPTVVLATSFEQEQALRADGARRVLTKPITPLAIFDVISDILQPEVQPSAAVSSAKVSLAGRTFLLVEDNEINQLVVQHILESVGAEVVIASNGRESLEKLSNAKDSFDAVLMDIQMPEMDGYEATRAIRRELGLTNLPIIAMTANVLPTDRERAKEAGMTAHLAKPIDIKELFSILAHLPIINVPQQKIKRTLAISTTFPTLPGIDVNQATQLLNGNAQLFERLLDRLAEQFGKIVIETRSDLARGNSVGAIQRMHTFRGVVGHLAASSISTLAGTIESALRNYPNDLENIDSLLSTLEASLSTLLAAAENQKKLVSESSEESYVPDTSLLHSFLDNLEKNDLDVLDMLPEIIPWYRRQFGDDAVKELGRAIKNLQFSQAATLFRKKYNEP